MQSPGERASASSEIALKESDGHIAKVTDEEILSAYKLAARTEVQYRLGGGRLQDTIETNGATGH